jgi:multiple sugar transport system permease protein
LRIDRFLEDIPPTSTVKISIEVLMLPVQAAPVTVPARARKPRHQWWGLGFVAPAVLFFLIFSLYPVGNAVYLSFFDFDLFNPAKFVGFENYRYLLESDKFHNSLLVTVGYVFGTCSLIWVISFALALVFNQQFRFRNLFIAIYFLPVVMPLVIAAMIWKTMYNPAGPINALLGREIPWLTNQATVLPAIIIMSVWKGVGYYLMLFLAGLSNIPVELYEAADLDGSSGWQKLWHITLPLMRPTIVFVVIVSIVIGFKVFVPMFVMTLGGPNDASLVLTLNIYETAFRFSRMGRAAAESVFLFLLLMGFSIIQLRLGRSANK